MNRLFLALLVGVSIAVVAWSSGLTAWWAVLVGLAAAGLTYALTDH